ncbi:hypothetical protein TCAL_07634 [Tigriopus californicus]|uniref:G-protein coupled receptors family 1 profile domain-containing protein n=1 Tax=Tigriopus californicus TaxID=6832 RepID=A0A553NVW7_TIGCA|nr:FMRFamide receptor-like [Tigriopus californicus]TRY69570.1 hypothetical protein TCAL_07634 [Tigriopus californicus]|eukprot:TCALIF_07634-PA protein Name:"Similar to FR FMRFamide receptor (Drosophila melanogaster)" AED:0.02 eAED:0.02 QI:157/1/0.66/1/0.8/0.83/6/0/595
MATNMSGILDVSGNDTGSANNSVDSGGRFEWATATNLTIFTLDVVRTNLNECYTMSKASQVWSTICEGILSVIVGICGLMGNGATIAVLSRPAFKETFHKLLVCLSLFDSLFIGSGLLIYAIRAHKLYLDGPTEVHYLFILLYPMANISLYGSIYVTMAISIERYLGVCYPVQSRTRPRRHLIIYLIPVVLFAVGFNLPKAFETKVVEVQDGNNHTRFQAMNSNFSTNTNYTHYYKVWSNLIVTTVIPLSVLIFCNVGIFVTLRKSRKSMFGVSNQRRQTVQQKNENGLAIILVGIVLVFMVCHASRFFLAFYHVSVSETTQRCLESEPRNADSEPPEWLYIVSAINHLMLMINSSVNFLIYCAVGSRFRNALTCRLSNRSSSRYTMTMRPQNNPTQSPAGITTTLPANPMDLSPELKTQKTTVLIMTNGGGTLGKSPLSIRRESGIFFEEELDDDDDHGHFDEHFQLVHESQGNGPIEDAHPLQGQRSSSGCSTPPNSSQSSSSSCLKKSLPPFRFLLKRHAPESSASLPRGGHSEVEVFKWRHRPRDCPPDGASSVTRVHGNPVLKDPLRRQETKSVKSYTESSTVGSMDQWL